MFDQVRWAREAVIPIAAGFAWLWCAAGFGVAGFLFSAIPGCLLLTSGVSILLWPGDTRIPSFTAMGGAIGVPLALPAFLVAGPGVALLLIALSAASYLVAGSVAVRWEPHVPGVPVPEPSLALAAQVGADEVILAGMLTTLPMVSGDGWRRVQEEVIEAKGFFESSGWIDKPTSYHHAPPILTEPELRPKRVRGFDFEHLRFESGYEPRVGEPGRERWLSYRPNRTAHAWVVRHPGPPRPWLVAIHGFQMGSAMIDLSVFDPRHFCERLGLNLVVPVLPFHGKRKVGRRSGDGFLTGDVMDTVHAEAQAMWDLRRILSWVRGQGAPAVGVHGVSLGGYQTALLACLEGDLACAIAGIPVSDIPRVFWRHGPALMLRQGEHHGVLRDDVDAVMRVVSPLKLEPQVPHDRRFLFGGVADRLVPPDQVQDLWLHWDRPRIAWYQGAHVTFRMDRGVRRLIREGLEHGGLVASRPGEPPAGEVTPRLRKVVG